MNPADLKTIAESLVFAAGNPISLRRLSEVIGVAQTDMKPALTLLREEYEASGRGIIFAEVAGGYQLRTSPDNAEYVKVLLQEKPSKLSRAALETLAIIAYRQPITKIEIESVRGVTVDGVLNSLLIKKLIREMGRKDVPGRPWVYGTTPQFLELFGLSDLSGLPPLPDIHEPTLNPLADDALNDTIENAFESSEGSTTDAGGDPDYYAEDTQSPTVNSTLHAHKSNEPNEPDATPEYEISDESSASAGEELSDRTLQQVPETDENGTGPEPNGEVNLSPTAEQAPDSASEQTVQASESDEVDASTDDGDAISGREDTPSPASEEVPESSRPETGESGSTPKPSGATIFSSTLEQAPEPASGQTLQADEADAVTDDGDSPSGGEAVLSPASEQTLESNRTETGENGSTPEPNRKADFSPAVEQTPDSTSGQTVQAGESNWTETSESRSAPEPSREAGEADPSTDDGDSPSGSENTPSVTLAQALESSRSDLAPESRDPDPSREGQGERRDDNPAGDDSESET